MGMLNSPQNPPFPPNAPYPVSRSGSARTTKGAYIAPQTL